MPSLAKKTEIPPQSETQVSVNDTHNFDMTNKSFLHEMDYDDEDEEELNERFFALAEPLNPSSRQ